MRSSSSTLMRIQAGTRRVTIPIALALVALGGCGKDVGGPTSLENEQPPDVDAYMAALPSWSTFAPPREAQNTATGPTSDPDVFTLDATEYSCTTTPYSLTQTPDRISVFNPDAEVLWLGGLLQGTGHRDGLGSLAELPIRQRAPLTIFIDLLSENVTQTVEDPDPASVASAIGELIERAEAVGHQAGSKIFFDQKETHSIQQASLELGVSARYLGTTVTSELAYEQAREENTLTAYFIQQMFTTSMVLPQTPGQVFSDAFTEALLQQQVALGRMGPDNLPTYVSSIVWGRMLMVTMTSTRSVEEMKAALTASNAAIGEGSIATEHLRILEESSLRISTVGGNDEGVENLIRTGQLGDYFAADLSLTQARPLSYTVRNLADNSIAVVSETTEYDLKQCSTSPADPTGATYRITLDKITLISEGCDVFPDDSEAEVYYSFSLHTDQGTTLVASRSAAAAVSMSEGTSHTLPANSNSVDLYQDGRGMMRVTGDAWDEDGTSNDDHIASWDLSWGYGVDNGQKFYTRPLDGDADCRVRLFVTHSKERDLYD